jgi:hypothetical protein
MKPAQQREVMKSLNLAEELIRIQVQYLKVPADVTHI